MTARPATLDDQLPFRIVRPYRVRFEESTPGEKVRPAIHLAWAADVAWQHSVLLGFGRDWYSAQNLFWLVRAVSLDVLRPIATYAEVMISTRVVAYRRVAARRESEVYDASGELLARLQIDWVMTNERGMPTRIPPDFHRFLVNPGSTFEMLKVGLPAVPADAAERRFHVRRRDLDPLDHVNNSVYLDYFEEALDLAGRQSELQGATPRRYEMEYLAAAGHGETLVDRVWPHDGGWAYLLCREDGTDLFRARMEPLR
jgi:acyl-ACP thioesterase